MISNELVLPLATSALLVVMCFREIFLEEAAWVTAHLIRTGFSGDSSKTSAIT